MKHLIIIGEGQTEQVFCQEVLLKYFYHKVIDGSFMAQDIGLSKMRAKCPRFDHWIEKLENI